MKSILLFELGGSSLFDSIDVVGTTTIANGSIFDIDFLGGYTASTGSFFDLLVADTILGDLSKFVFDFSDASGVSWNSSIFSLSNNRQALRLTASTLVPSTIPLPASLPLMLAGLAGLGWVARRRTRA